MQNKFIIIFITAFTLVFIVSCSEDSTTEPTPTTTIQTPAAKLSDIQVKVFNVTCALSGCHGATNNQAGLLLTDGNSYSELVNVQGEVFTNYTRVIPDSSAQSLIIKLIKGALSPRMPLDRDPLPAAVIDSIAKWIDNGALNN
jgi:hypothetical protein